MSEPFVPVPDPDPDGYRDPHPGRCPICGAILQSVNPMDATGWCPDHGRVMCSYRFVDEESDLKNEIEKGESDANSPGEGFRRGGYLGDAID